MQVADELFKIADRVELQSKKLQEDSLNEPLNLLSDAANIIGKAWSGSWLGYHSRVYYADLADPPLGARFSKEWGLMGASFIEDTIGDWQEYRFDDVISVIQERCGNPNTSEQFELASRTKVIFEESQSNVLSLFSTALNIRQDDKFLTDISKKVEDIQVFSASDFVNAMHPTGQVISRDMPALHAGLQTPPHLSVIARLTAIRSPFKACEELSKFTRRAASHIQNIEKHKVKSERIGTNVFIGHGRSASWRDLKDFIQDRMRLPWDEFNRVPIAGVTNITRLSQMLDEAAIAFLIMTAEDEQADGTQHARQNVIHEAGLFQGRLGFQRAILLLEHGCEEFSNVQGLGQIRFPKGNISAVFEDIRKVLEREGLVDE
jgi:predicted nucleotide-binding protein